ELAKLLHQHRELDDTVLSRLLSSTTPAPVRLLAADSLLEAGPCPEAGTALQELARLPNREIALSTAEVVQRRLGEALGLPRPERMLAHYCQVFPLVELNFTFYRPPSREILLRLADKTPAGFQFLVKLPRTVSHERSPRDLPGFRHAVEGLAQRHQLAGLLCQLPQSAHNTAEVRGWLKTLAGELSDLRLAVEVRHRSWARAGLPD